MSAVADDTLATLPLAWVNCPPQSLAEHRGKVLALVFWNAGSSYCRNLLDDVQTLQRRHAEGLDIVGVHVPKFDAERSRRFVQKALCRLQLSFPVAQDDRFAAWQAFGITAWPSVVLFDPVGRRGPTFVGDMQREALDQAIGALLERATMRERVFAGQPACAYSEPALPLAFPAGLAVGSNHLYVADSSHHRVLECTLEGRILRQFGSGSPGLLDGDAAESCFRFPHGLHLTRDGLYVADTGNHALRRVRLLDGAVETLAGTGRPGMLDAGAALPGAGAALNAPMAISSSFDRLYLAMAGANQIWELDQGQGTVRALAGAGNLGLADGGGTRCAFAQPTSMVLVEQSLYIVDAAASAVRCLHLPSGAVHTLAGHGLFEFGDSDGVRSQARMQYPTAVAHDGRTPQLWIADSYNNCVRTLRLSAGELRRHAVDHPLAEPAALAVAGGALWIANTNAHEVLRVDLAKGLVRRLPIGE